jgi:hypothetical protein
MQLFELLQRGCGGLRYNTDSKIQGQDQSHPHRCQGGGHPLGISFRHLAEKTTKTYHKGKHTRARMVERSESLASKFSTIHALQISL